MLHRINPARCKDRLERIVQFQRKVLAFACDPATPLSPTESDIRNAFREEGEWLWGRMKVKRKNGEIVDSPLRKAMKRLIKYCRKNQTMGKKIVEAFDHDIEFHTKIDDASFQFHYSRLSKSTKKEVRPLMESFYNELLESGFPKCVHGDREKLDRERFVDAFKAANPKLKVCPACDGPRAETERLKNGEEKTYADTDHFLPKSKYPFLSVHPVNLVPVCIYCNRPFKGSRDPIDNQYTEPLKNIFHPYLKPARDHIDVLIDKGAAGQMGIRIEDKNGHPSKRVNSLNKVFRLETRWPSRLEEVKGRIIEAILHDREVIRKLGGNTDADSLRSNLELTLKDKESRIGEDHWYILHSSYLSYALGRSGTGEFDDLLQTFTMP